MMKIKMRELRDDSFYEILKEYDGLVVDYCLMESAFLHQGYSSHKEAILFTMQQLNQDYPWISLDGDKAAAKEITSEELFAFPDKPWKENAHGTVLYHVDFSRGGRIPYWYAFLEPPHGTGPLIREGKMIRKNYDREDFETVNGALFPKGTDELEIYEWSTDWSSYFDAGHEWWGTICCSIYDKKMKRYVVILASSTD